MRFCVVTITYNAEKFLAQTLDSVATQEGVEFEHILWDGGSSDATLDIISRYPHIKLFQGKDQGIADAMNKGAAHASGDFLLHLHADDLLSHSNSLLMVERTLKQHPTLKWLYGKVEVIDEAGQALYVTPYEAYSYKRLCRYNFISHPATFVKRGLFEKVGGFRSSLRYCMDYDLWLRLAKTTCPMALNTSLAYFRQHSGSLSTSEPHEVADEAYQVRNVYVRSLYERYRSYRTWKKRKKRAAF